MKLSIGMIVKNEEKYLDECLKSLDSLRKSIPCELIIADTGSTDRTKEIAAKYADILFDFEWCDDFSAARNSTRDKATGDWFLFIDADEIFVSTADVEQFFLSGEYKNYNAASYTIRSFLNPDKVAYLDFSGVRFINITRPNTRFINAIHESIPADEPIKPLNDIAHHYGYIHDGETEIKKHERNLTLLFRELEKNPNDIRILGHLSREYSPSEEAEEVICYANRGLHELRQLHKKALSKNLLPKGSKLVSAHTSFFVLFHQKMVALHNLDKWDELIETCKEYFKGKSGDLHTDIDSYWFCAKAYFNLQKYSEALEMYEEYFRLYDLKKDGKLQTDDMMHTYIHCGGDNEYHMALMNASVSAISSKEYEKAFLILDKLPLNEIEYLQPVFRAFDGSGKFEYILTLWNRYAELGDKDKLENFLYYTEDYIRNTPSKRTDLIRVLSDYCNDDSCNYALLNQMRMAAFYVNGIDLKKYLNQLLIIKPFPRLLDDAIYYAMYQNIDISILFESVVLDDLKIYIADIKEGHSDFAEVVKNYFMENRYINSDYGMYWELMFEEAALLTNDLYDEDALELLPNYLEAIISYTNLIYDKQMLNEDKLGVLPNYARFAYYVGQSLESDNIGDELGYYRNMTKAIDQYKVMAKPIKLLTDHHQKEIEDRKNKAKQDNQELMELAAQVKKQLYAFIEQENYPTAKDVLAGYEKIVPTDPDLTTIREMIVAGESGNQSAIPS